MALPSTGFRPLFGPGRVTLERPKVTKGLLPRQAVRFADSLAYFIGSDGAPHTAHPCAACGCAVIHDGAPDQLNSARRLAGGNTLPVCGEGGWCQVITRSVHTALLIIIPTCPSITKLTPRPHSTFRQICRFIIAPFAYSITVCNCETLGAQKLVCTHLNDSFVTATFATINGEWIISAIFDC